MITIPKDVLRRCIEALRDKAKTDAAASQEPYLYTKQETQEWSDAAVIEAALRTAGTLRTEITPREEK